MKKVLTVTALLLTSIIALSQYTHIEEDGMLCHHAKAANLQDYVFNPTVQSPLLFDYDVKFYHLTINVENNTIENLLQKEVEHGQDRGSSAIETFEQWIVFDDGLRRPRKKANP